MQVRFSPGSGTSGRSGQRVLAGWRERPVGSPEPGTSCHRRPRPSWKAPEWPRDAPVEIENGQENICFNNDLLKFNPNCFACTVAQCSVTTYFMFWQNRGSRLFSHPAALGSIPSNSLAKILMLLRLVETGQWFQNVDQTHLDLDGGKPVQQKD